MTTHTHPSRQRPLQTLPVLLGLLVQAAIASPALAKPTLAPQRFVVIPKTHHPWFDKVRKGARAAAVMIEAQTGGKASIDYRPPSKADAGEQANILEAAIRSRPTGITVVATPIDQDSITIAEQQALATMERHPQLRGWVVADAGGGIGVGRAIQNLNRTGDVKVVALDDLPEQLEQIQSGLVDSTVATKPHAQGYWAVVNLWQHHLDAPTIERIDTGIRVHKGGTNP